MPIYEFRCRDCGGRSSVFTRSFGVSYEAKCSHCQSGNVERVMSQFAYQRSEQSVLEEFGADPQRLEDFRDPRQIGRSTERFFKEHNMEMPEEARKMIDAAREGEMPAPLKDL